MGATLRSGAQIQAVVGENGGQMPIDAGAMRPFAFVRSFFNLLSHCRHTAPVKQPPTHPPTSLWQQVADPWHKNRAALNGPGISEGRNLKPRLSAYTWKQHPAHLLSLFAPHFSFSAFMLDPPQTCNAGWVVIEGAGLRLLPSAFRPLRAAVCSCRCRNSNRSTCRPGNGSEVGGGGA